MYILLAVFLTLTTSSRITQAKLQEEGKLVMKEEVANTMCKENSSVRERGSQFLTRTDFKGEKRMVQTAYMHDVSKYRNVC